MENNINPLPFFFREIGSSKQVLLTNQAGSFSFLDNRQQLEECIAGNTSTLSENKIEELIAKSFIAEPSDFSSRINLIASKCASSIHNNLVPPSLFLIIPTLRCDHDCGYCQVSRVPLKKQGYDLSEDRISSILEYIRKTGSQNVKIEFQGGEPLIAFDFIKQFVALAEEYLSDRNLSFVICSALGPFKESMFSFLKQHRIVLSISLDGSEVLHNKNRPSRYFNSYRNTISCIEKIKKELGEDCVNCLATATKDSLHEPKALVHSFFEIGLNSIFVRPLSPFGFASKKYHHIGYTAQEYFAFYKCMLEEVLLLNQNRLFIEESSLIHLKKIFRPSESGFIDLQSPAGYVLGAMVFNYDGNIFGSDEARMLWETTKNPELIIGTLKESEADPFQKAHAISILSDTFLNSVPGCDECAYQPYCGADPMYHLATQKDHIGNKTQSFFCKLERMMFDHIFELYETSPGARKVFSKWLSR